MENALEISIYNDITISRVFLESLETARDRYITLPRVFRDFYRELYRTLYRIVFWNKVWKLKRGYRILDFQSGSDSG